jgi:hypothetical protein
MAEEQEPGTSTEDEERSGRVKRTRDADVERDSGGKELWQRGAAGERRRGSAAHGRG